MQIGRHVRFPHHAAPGHITRIARLHRFVELAAHRRAYAIGTDEQIACSLSAIAEMRSYARGVFLIGHE